MKRILGGMGAVLLVIAGAVVMALAFPGFWLKPLLESRLSARLDRDVQIEGAADLAVFDPPEVFAHDISVANPDWAEEPWLLQAERLRVTFDAGALWSLSLKPTAIGLRAPRLYLARRDGGAAATWDVAGMGGGQDGGLQLERLTVENGRFRYRATDRDTDLTGTLSTTAEGTRYSASGTYKGRETEASGTGGGLLVLLRGEGPWPLEAEITAGGHDVSLQGTATGLPAATALDLTMVGAGPSLKGLGELVGGGLPSSPPYDLAGRLTLQDGRWQFSDASGSIGGSAVAGMIAVEPVENGGGPTRLTVDLSSTHLEAGDVRAVLGEPGASRNQGPTPIPAEALQAYDADVKIDADELLLAGRALPDARLRATLQDGRLRVEQVSAGVGGGRFEGTAEVAAAKAPPTATVSLTLNRLELKPLAGVESVRGVFGGEIEMTSSGETVQDMRGNADGRVTLLLSDGRLTREWLEMAQFGLSDIAGIFIPEEDTGTDIRCAAVRFDIAGGVADAQALYADTAAAVVRGDGTVNLVDLTLDLAFTMDPKGAVVFAYDGPVHVTGPISDPAIEAGGVASTVLEGLGAVALGTVLTPVAAAVPFINTAVGDQGGCRQAMDEAVAQDGDGGGTGSGDPAEEAEDG